MSTSSIYGELPLGSGHFRLLHLAAGANHDALTAKLVAYKISEPPSYEAISYHWGTSTRADQLSLDGAEVGITASAAAALRSCRHTDGSVYVWIDQICIDQSNAVEQSAQIMLMGKIYSQAAQVNICLGPQHDSIGQVFELAKEINDLRAQTSISRKWYEAVPMSTKPLVVIPGSELRLPEYAWSQLARFDESAGQLALALATLLEDPWFLRAWVVQEAVLAERLSLVYKHHKISWTALFELVMTQIEVYKRELQPRSVLTGLVNMCAIDLLRQSTRPSCWLMRTKKFRGNLRGDMLYPTWMEVFSNARISLDDFLNSAEDISLLGIMRHFRGLESTDKRDKIFGFLGLARPDPEKSSMAYTGTISDVCVAFACQHIISTGTLDVLMASCFGATAHEDLPFWVPDWSFETTPCDTEYGCPLKNWPHRAGGDTVAEPEVMASEKALILKGVFFDVIDAVTGADHYIDINSYNDPTHKAWERWQSLATQVYEPTDPYRDNGEGHFDAFWRTLMYNVDGRGRLASPIHGNKFRTWLRGGLKAEDSGMLVGRFIFKNRGLYRTKRGYMGNGCSHMQPGDRVFVLRGGRLPFILRPDRLVEGRISPTPLTGHQDHWKSVQGYKLIGGDTYVHGLCNGEAWSDAAGGSPELEIALV